MKAAVQKAGDELVEAAATAVVDVAKDAMKDGVVAVKEIVKEAIEDGKEIAVAAMEEGKETIVHAIKDDEPVPAMTTVNVSAKCCIDIDIGEIIIDESKIPPHIAAEIAAHAAEISAHAAEEGIPQEPAPGSTTSE